MDYHGKYQYNFQIEYFLMNILFLARDPLNVWQSRYMCKKRLSRNKGQCIFHMCTRIIKFKKRYYVDFHASIKDIKQLLW
jgi:hypothetical protein